MHGIEAFWPLDYDQEDAIYDSPAWDMPGLKKRKVRPEQPRDPRGLRRE